jgi:hypothetical protein
MINDLEQRYKQFIIDFKTVCAYGDMNYYNEIVKAIENIKVSLENKYKHTHCDDDNTNKVLSNAIDYLDSTISCFEDLKFYDGDGNRF